MNTNKAFAAYLGTKSKWTRAALKQLRGSSGSQYPFLLQDNV